MRFFTASLVFGSLALDGQADNPIFTAADPHAVIIDKRVWIYPTGGGPPTEFFAWSSGDLVHWKQHGPVFRLRDAAWIKDDGAPNHWAWAPCTIEDCGRYFFYYSVGPQNPTPSRIGVAVSDAPAGPFKDSSKPLLTGDRGFEAIDPFVFRDPKTRKAYLYAGGSAGAKLRTFELNADLVSIAREVSTATPEKFTEGAFVHVWKDRYYLSYSHGNWKDHTYSVHYSISDSPEGPWRYKGAILTSDRKHKGPGHHSLIRMQDSGRWFIIYHRWNRREGDGPYDGSRETCIDSLEHAPDGSIRTVKMSDSGVGL
jgi:beta-xylosidase